MSSDPVDIGEGILVGWFAGPARSDGGPRRRWQITSQGQYIQLTYEQMCALRHWFRDQGDAVPPFLPEAAAAAHIR